MFDSVTIDRFRGFGHLHMPSFDRINLIAGRNNTGKTAVLEAIFLLLGPTQPALATAFNHRGQSRLRAPLPPLLRYESEWRDLFYARDTSQTVTIAGELRGYSPHKLEISMRDALTEVYESGSGSGSGWSSEESSSETIPATASELVYRYFADGELKAETVASARGTTSIIARERLVINRDRNFKPKLPRALLLNTLGASRAELADRFSRVRERRLQGEVEEVLGQIDPRVRSLVVTAIDQRPAVAVELVDGQTMPLRMMGEGFGRAVELLLALYDATGGVVLIDEIENGLHYSVLRAFWGAVATAARRSNTQVIATTHSLEAIRAAHECFVAGDIYDFKLHRLDRSSTENMQVTTFDRQTLGTSLDLAWEVR